jgi:hypothetical protein
VDWFLIDGIGAFFRHVPGEGRVNWSKVPFSAFERDGRIDTTHFDSIRADFARFAERAAAIGYNGITLDDLAHLTDCADYPPELRENIRKWRSLFRDLCGVAESCGLAVFVTTDVMFLNRFLRQRRRGGRSWIMPFLSGALDALFTEFPAVKGSIVRIGEADGVDVTGMFSSELTIRTPRQARALLEALLPVCERRGRELVFRTWSVGAYSIGDLNWNRNTLRAVLRGIESPRLIVSIKYGETDFFRYLALNKQFLRTSHRKIIELQARREYEGFGAYPSFVGWEYQTYRDALARVENVVGIQVWCQTGGWSRFRELTLLDRSVWNELNTWVSLRLFKHGESAETAVEAWAEHNGCAGAPLIELLALSDEVIRELLYVDDFAAQKIFFRRLRLPPLLYVFWDHVLVNHTMRKILRCFVEDGQAKIDQGYAALEKIREMQELAASHGLPDDGLELQYDTFQILAVAREYFFGPFDEAVTERLHALVSRYKDRHRVRYSIHLDFRDVRIKRRHLRLILGILLRDKRGYRVVDWAVNISLLGLLHPVIKRIGRRYFPDFAHSQAMGIDVVLR